MKELVGYCTQCEREVFCVNGFLEGEVTEEQKVICFNCVQDDKKINPGQDDQGD